MGLLEALSGRKKILTYELAFGDAGEVGVRVTPQLAEVPRPEDIRLWAFYQAKIIYNLGYPDSVSATIALGSVAKVVQFDIQPDTDCFERANLSDVARFVHGLPLGGVRFTGEFYAKGAIERVIQTHFPLRATEQQVVYSGLALLQHAVSVNRADPESLAVLTRTGRNFLSLYESGFARGITALVEVPTLAYLQAIGAV